MRMHKSPPAVGSVDINQRGKYLLNSQTVNDSQTRSSYWFDNSGGTTGLIALGTYSRIAITDNNALDITGANTIELVVEFNELGLKQTLFIKGSNSSSNWYSYHLRLNTDDKIYYALSSDTYGGSANLNYARISEDSGFVTGRPYHIVATWDGEELTTVGSGNENMKLYVDGVLLATQDSTVAGTLSKLATNSDVIEIGADPSTGGRFGVRGEISKARLYNRALTSTEVKDAYSGKAVPYADIGAS